MVFSIHTHTDTHTHTQVKLGSNDNKFQLEEDMWFFGEDDTYF